MVTLRTIIISSSWAEHSKQSSVQLKTKALHRETWLAKLFIHPIYPSPFDLVTHFCPFSPSSSFYRHHKSIPSCRSNCNNNNHTHTPPLKPPEDDDLMIITSNSLRVLYRRPSSTLLTTRSVHSSPPPAPPLLQTASTDRNPSSKPLQPYGRTPCDLAWVLNTISIYFSAFVILHLERA